jgi:hypothetical protein
MTQSTLTSPVARPAHGEHLREHSHAIGQTHKVASGRDRDGRGYNQKLWMKD